MNNKSIRKADICFRDDFMTVRITVTLEGGLSDYMAQIEYAISRFNNGLKIESIYFREE